MQESTVYRSIFAEGEAKKQREIALNFLQQGLSVEAVAHGTGLAIAEVQQLQQQLNEPAQNLEIFP
jgi:predicted transposase YdaD